MIRMLLGYGLLMCKYGDLGKHFCGELVSLLMGCFIWWRDLVLKGADGGVYGGLGS